MPFRSFPKIELHLHLDCSLSYAVASRLDQRITPEWYRGNFVAPPKSKSLAEYIRGALEGIRLMQTVEQLEAVTLDLFEQLKDDNVCYAEIRFAPLEHTREGLTAEQVVGAVESALRQGISATGIAAGLILCTLRHYDERQSLEVVRLVEQFRGNKVAGFDLAADEAGYPIDAHIAAFRYARQRGIPCTAHAGEAKGSESVWETLRHFGVRRIGHGVRSIEDEELLEWLKKEKIHLEVCPTSNIQTDIFPTITDHPVDRLLRLGLSVGINTDGRALSGISLSEEYRRLAEAFGWGKEEFLQCNFHALEASFTSGEEREKIKKRLIEGWEDEGSTQT